MHVHATLQYPTILANFANLQTLDVWQSKGVGHEFSPPHLDDLFRFTKSLAQHRSAKKLFIGGFQLNYLDGFLPNDYDTAFPTKPQARDDDTAGFRALEELVIFGLPVTVPVYSVFLHAACRGVKTAHMQEQLKD